MCGKYILAQAAKAELAMGIRRGRWEYPVSYRVLPSEQVPVVTLESGERVIYMGSTSKLLFPSLRLSYMVVPPSLADAYASALSLTCRLTPVYQQAVLAAFVDEGHFARHLHRMRLLYSERARIFQHEFKARFGDSIRAAPH